MADRNEMMDGGDDVECKPAARHDNSASMIVGQKALLPNLALIECGDIAAVLHRWRYRLPRLLLLGALSVQQERIGRDRHGNLQGDVYV